MLPIKETNSSEESECDDLDPNTSMEVEAAIVLFTTMIVCFDVFCNSDLAQVTSQSRIRGDIRAFLGVPSNLQKAKQNWIQFNFDLKKNNNKFFLDAFLKTSGSLEYLLIIFFFGRSGFV